MLTYKRGETAYEADPATLSETAKAYLLQYGWAQSLQDAIAGASKAKAAELLALDSYKNGTLSLTEMSVEIELHVHTKLAKRATAIREGTVAAHTGATRDPLLAIAREQVNGKIRQSGKTVTKEKLAELVANHIAKNGDKLRAELARRKDDTEVDLDF